MVEGIFSSSRSFGCNSGLEIWVAIPFSDVTSLIEKIEQRLRDVLRSLPTIFAHPEECGPVPRTEQGKKSKPSQTKLTTGREEAIEVRKAIGEAVADALDAIERDVAHGGEAGDGGGFHVDEGGLVRGREAVLFGVWGHFWAGGKPEFARAGIAVEALASAHVDDSSDVVGRAGGDFGAKRSGPADGEDEIDGTSVFDGVEGARGGGLAGSGAVGDPLFFFAALGPETNAVAGAVLPAADERLQFAR